MASALIRGARCYACRYDILQSFVALSGLSVVRSVRPGRPPTEPLGRYFSIFPSLKSENSNAPSENANPENFENSSDSLDKSSSKQPVPWYLQVEQPELKQHHVSQRQEIPAVPENSPVIVKDLLQYLSVDAGLDDLVLLDLRGRDPPPALGGSLIMVIGTARSLKHLNVSADRFCRWLRSSWKLRPYADGLLGRGELKIKLRRKARRARIASNAGATLESSDDGITTGWICVNVGHLKDPSTSQRELNKDESFEGFGKTAGGTRIVVQMLTEEKRSDVDLEKLWAPVAEVKGRNRAQHQEATAIDSSGGTRQDLDMQRGIDTDSEFASVRRSSSGIAFDQHRNFSTGTMHMADRRSASKQSSPNDITNTKTNEDTSDVAMIIETLRRLSPDKVRAELGDGPGDHDSTLLLQMCHSAESPSASKASEVQLRLACAGTSVHHPRYTKLRLWETFLEHTASGYPLDDNLAFDIVSAFLTQSPANIEGGQPKSSLSEFDIESALRVLDFLSLKGTDILNMRVFSMLYGALNDGQTVSADQVDGDVVTRIRTVMEALHLQWDPQMIRAHMEMRMKNSDFEGFYKLWNAIPFHEETRSQQDYELLFRLFAESGDSLRIRECLSTWVPMMEREEPKISLQGPIASYLAACLHRSGAPPPTEGDQHTSTFYADLWGKCMLELEI
jgi:peroxin-12